MKVETRAQINGEHSLQSLTLQRTEEDNRALLVEKYNDEFIYEYLFGDRSKAMALVPFIDPDHDDGFFIYQAAKKSDVDMVRALLERGATVGIQDALEVAALKGDGEECIKLLIQHGANPLLLQGTMGAFHPYIEALLP
jgi:ankyrin repeat protein